ncbi:MAG: hypothetical protein K0S65_4005 [Labilithrix sp.]|nr:hypothetical protein [Labilithrix sp.]
MERKARYGERSIVIGKKKRSVTEERLARPQPQRIRYPVAVLIRMFLIGSVAIVACCWAIWRHYTVPRMPMVVPATPAPSASEIEIEPAP